ncbi:MAG: hypothetical protein GY913_21085 [Proteobacteria bacterium]|nr:hypothetical protein [Pseudomonadota bacterium]MCP4919403.1 hypothetical protein [Pseudomonadota bacterium]
MSWLRRNWPLVAVLLFGPVVLSWPLPLVFTDHVLAHPHGEAAAHIWGLWTALSEGALIDSPGLRYPDGFRIVLVDPGNLPTFALGAPLGPAAAYNTALFFGFVIAGAGGALLSRHVGGNPWVGALVAMCAPGLLASGSEGTTEDFGVGWVIVQLAFLLRWVSHSRKSDLVLAILSLAMAWYTGPYNGVWASGISGAVGLWLLVKDRAGALRAAAVGAGALVLVAPLAWAVLTLRDPGMPGGSMHPHSGHVPEAFPNPEFFRGGLWHGADLTDPWLPVLLTGGEAPVSRTAYVGMFALILSIWAVWRRRELWPLLAGSLAFTLVSFGPWLYLFGETVAMGPVGWAESVVEPITRLTRWYRAGAVAALLLAPLVSSIPYARFLVPLVVLDALFLAPLQWPLHATPLPQVGPLAETEGALLEVPAFVTGLPPEGQWLDHTALAQILHERSVPGSMMGMGPPHSSRTAYVLAREASIGVGQVTHEERRWLLEQGYTQVVVWKELAPRADLTEVFGPPEYEDDTLAIHRLSE